MRLKAYAKVNLFLEITGKRPDGYHALSTIFQTVSLADELTFRAHHEVRLSCSDPSLPVDERNLMTRAAMTMQRLLKEHSGVHMTLDKKIPLGAGLGGGSSDAAAVLLALSKLWRKPSTAVLQKCARELGADVPFFLTGGTYLGEGIGDQLKKLPALPKTWLVLVYPGFGVSTRNVYARVQLPFKDVRSAQRMIPLLKAAPEAWVGELFNRFEDVVFPAYPKLAAIKQELLDAGALGALMSGSGSTVFGVVFSPAQGRSILKQLRKKYPQTWLVHTV